MDHIKDFNLEHFLSVQAALGKTYGLDKKANTEESEIFSKQIIKSVEYLIEYSKGIEKEKEFSLYTSFLNKIKEKLENSEINKKDTILEPFYRVSRKIATLAQYIINLDNTDKDLPYGKQTLFTNTIAYFDFVEKGDKIAFSKFTTNKELFEKQKEIILNNIQNIGIDINTINHLILSNIKESVIYFEINQQKRKTKKLVQKIFGKNSPKEALPEYKDLNTYIEIQKDRKTDPVLFEIFSYTLLQKTKVFLENFSFTDNKIIRNYLNENIKKIDMFYNNNYSLGEYYIEIQKLDDELLKKQ